MIDRDLEEQVKLGDRDAMVRYLKDAFLERLSKEEREKRFELVLNSDHGYDAAVVRNLGLVAAVSGLTKHAFDIADDLTRSDLLADAMHIYIAIIDEGMSEQSQLAWSAIENLACRGHIRSQVFLRKRRMSGTIASRIALGIFQLVKLVQATAILLKNRSDPRIGL